ncbi:MAG: oligosaccharide flippase family protein [Fimbriimonadales bacterium]
MSGFKRKAISGFFWQAFGLVGQQGIQLIANLLFARLLLKEENGVLIAAIAILDYATLLRVSGILQAFVAYEGDDTEARHTVFWASLLSGLAMCAALFFGAPFIASWLNSDGLTPVLRALSVMQLIDSIRIVPFALIWRHLRFKERTIAETVPFIAGLVSAAVGLAILPREQRIYAVVWMYLVRSVGQALLFLYFEPYRPALKFDWPFFRLISRRSVGVLAFNLPSSTLVSLPSIAVFGRAGEAAGGAFGLATKLTAPATSLSYAANITLFPIFAQLKNDAEKLKASILRSLKGAAVLPIALLTFIIATAPELIPVVLGEKWRSAVPAARWIALAGIFQMYSFVLASVLLAASKTIYIIVTWTSTLVLAAALLFLVPMAQGDALAGGQITAAYGAFGFVMSLGATSIAMRMPVGSILSTLVPASLSAAAAVAASLVLGEAVHDESARLAVKTLAFGVVFLPACGILLGGSWRSLLTPQGLRELIGRN